MVQPTPLSNSKRFVTPKRTLIPVSSQGTDVLDHAEVLDSRVVLKKNKTLPLYVGDSESRQPSFGHIFNYLESRQF